MDILTFLTKYNLDSITFAYDHSNGLQHLVDKYDKNMSTKEYDFHNEYYVKILNEYKKLFDIKIDEINEDIIHKNVIKLKNEYPTKNDHIDSIIKKINEKFKLYITNFQKKNNPFASNINKIQFFEKIYNAFVKNKHEMKEFINKNYTHLLYAYIVLKFIIDKVDEISN